MTEPQTWRYPALLPFSWLYAGAVRLRNWGYEAGLFETVRVPATVISVGNLTVGGAGKTPLVAWLANALADQGLRVAIVARGYRREGRGTCIVSDGRGQLADLKNAGDEPLLLAHKCPRAAIVVDRSKSVAAQIAAQRFQPQIILIDDGFQHRRLQREGDIVLMPAHLLSSPAWLLPAGPWREPPASLRRAHVVALTGIAHLPGEEQRDLVQTVRRYTPATILAVNFVAGDLEHLSGESRLAREQLRQAEVFLVSGIGNPWRFREMTAGLHARLAGELIYRDHHRFTAGDAAEIAQRFRAAGAHFIITTAKDAIKLRQFENLLRLPCFVLEICFHAAPPDRETLLAFVDELRRRHTP